MPVSVSYPGVYIQEVPSQSNTIVGASTSITAFIGRALRGPINEPTTITSYADFQRIFGGLWLNNLLGFAVNDYFLNGGNQAIIVRLTDTTAAASTVSLPAGTDNLNLVAANSGAWGNNLQVSIDTSNVSAEVAQQFGVQTTDLFNLTVTDTGTNTTETYFNLTVISSPNEVDAVLLNQSQLINVSGALPSTVPTATTSPVSFTGGSDGGPLTSTVLLGNQAEKTGLYALENASQFNLLCIPGYNATFDVDQDVMVATAAYCQYRTAFYIVDAPSTWTSESLAQSGIATLGITGPSAANAAVFFPRVIYPNPLVNNQLQTFVPCGMIAGTMARIDGQRGIWKAPAGTEAALQGVTQLTVPLTDAENGLLNPLAVNCLRTFPATGTVIWGSRTLQGNDLLGSQWKYIPVRRLTLYIEQSVYQGTQWAVFEPNADPLWRAITLSINSFMNNLYIQGAFQGQTVQDAYFVKCDSTTTTQTDINNGIVNIIIGFAPVKPAEFVVISIQQIAGQ